MRHLLFTLFVLFPAFASAKPGVAFYVCAHPDDCLLFMSPNIYDDTVKDTGKVAVIYLTSGDAGQAFGKEGTPVPYPYVRELASLDATGWMADVGKEPVHAQQRTEAVRVHGHDIERVSYANTVSYFLRLPDGNFDGNGFARYGYRSLRKLKSGEIKSISPIDGQAAYTGWQDLVAVLSGILARETEGETEVALHLSEPDTQKNDNDHSDHTTGASGVMEALALIRKEQGEDRCYRIYRHIDYAIAQRPVNLDGEALQNKSGGFAVLTATQRRYLGAHNWDNAHLPYLTRNYYTDETLPHACDKAH